MKCSFKKNKTIICCSLFIIVAFTGLILSQDQVFFTKQKAVVESEKKALDYLKEEVIRRGISFEETDIFETGLIGPEFSELTTTPGSESAKRTSLNPLFSAAILRYFKKAGLKAGDCIGINASGSFPGFAIASLTAAKEYGLKVKLIASCGASMHGATRPEFNIFDIVLLLKEAGFADYELLAVSPGGVNDNGGSLLEDIIYENTEKLALDLCYDVSKQTGCQVINILDFDQNVKERIKMFGNIDLFINIGGSSVSIGNYEGSGNFPKGLVLNFEPSSTANGLCAEYARSSVPIINLLDAKTLASENNIEFDSMSGSIQKNYNVTGLIITLLASFMCLTPATKRGKNKFDPSLVIILVLCLVVVIILW